MTTFWTASQLAELHRLRAMGKTASQVGRAIGKSRDAVCGQMYRLAHAGEPRKKSPNKPKPSVKPFWKLDGDERREALWRRSTEGAAKLRVSATGVNETLTASRELGGERIAP